MLPQWILSGRHWPGAAGSCGSKIDPPQRRSPLSGHGIVDASLFRILRNAEVELDEEDNESLREAITEALRQRRFEPVVRVDFAPGPSPAVRQALVDRFELTDEELYEVPGLLDYTSLFQIAGLNLPALRDPHWTPMPPSRLPDEHVDVFEVIRAGDVLLHHPYDSFDLSVEHFISEAAADPNGRHQDDVPGR
jgi:polyphosphate kinase